MGSTLSRLKPLYYKKILILGNYGVGKTKLLNELVQCIKSKKKVCELSGLNENQIDFLREDNDINSETALKAIHIPIEPIYTADNKKYIAYGQQPFCNSVSASEANTNNLSISDAAAKINIPTYISDKETTTTSYLPNSNTIQSFSTDQPTNLYHPTPFFTTTTLHHNSTSTTIWDISGTTQMQTLWKCYFHSTNGIIYVINSYNFEFELQILKNVIIDFHIILNSDNNTIITNLNINSNNWFRNNNKKLCVLVYITDVIPEKININSNNDCINKNLISKNNINLSVHDLKTNNKDYLIEFKNPSNINNNIMVDKNQQFNIYKSKLARILLDKSVFNVINNNILKGYEWLLEVMSL
ncbi:ADP-ribosylation factor-like protein 2 [Cucumispora dikerogammari]|nr:ADP-ribosylation factor-like protein 2 [Cucumispora dikerogammari]